MLLAVSPQTKLGLVQLPLIHPLGKGAFRQDSVRGGDMAGAAAWGKASCSGATFSDVAPWTPFFKPDGTCTLIDQSEVPGLEPKASWLQSTLRWVLLTTFGRHILLISLPLTTVMSWAIRSQRPVRGI